MNAMYDMSIDLHDGAVLILVAVFVMNMVLLAAAQDIRVYAKRMRMLMPISAAMIASVIFTGVVMMAAKQLSFTIENIVMILFSIVLIILEAKRYKTLKYLKLDAENAFGMYKSKAMKFLGVGLGGAVLISAWMLL